MRLSTRLAVMLLLIVARSYAQAPPQESTQPSSKASAENSGTGSKEAEKPSNNAAKDSSEAPATKDGAGPKVEKLNPASGDVGDPITITGTGFGDKPGKVKFGSREAKTSWSDKSIVAVVPNGASSGSVVVVTADGKESTPSKADANSFTLKAEYDHSSFELVTGVGAELAGIETTSYKIDTDNNALSQTNVGRKTVEILLGGGFILPWHKWGRWIEKSYCGTPTKEGEKDQPCREGGDAAYKNYRPWETFLSIRFAPASDQTINGFVVGGGYRITKYFSLLVGYSVTPVNEPTHGFRVAASQVVAANPTISPYNHFNASDLLHDTPGAFDGFPLFLYNANGITTTKIFPTSPIVVHYHSGIYFGVGIPLNLTALFKPSAPK